MENWYEKYKGLIPGIDVFYPEEGWIDIKSTNKKHLHTYRFPCHNPAAILFIYHGLGAHGNCLAHIAELFADQNVLALSLDYENHGKSEGTRGRVVDIRSYVSDALTYIEKVRELYGDLPIFLLGESLGGLIAIQVSLRLEYIKGILLISPALAFGTGIRGFVYNVFKILGQMSYRLKMISPGWSMGSRNMHINQACSEDPYTYTDRGYACTYTAFSNMYEEFQGKFSSVKVPFFLLQGGSDPICDPSFAVKFVEEASSSDKHLLMIEDMCHAISIEEDIYELTLKMIKWVKYRI